MSRSGSAAGLTPWHDRSLYAGALVLLMLSASQWSYAPKQGIHTVVHVTPADVLVWLIGVLIVLPVFERNRTGRAVCWLLSASLIAAGVILSHHGHAFLSVLHHGRHSGQFKSAALAAGALALACWTIGRLLISGGLLFADGPRPGPTRAPDNRADIDHTGRSTPARDGDGAATLLSRLPSLPTEVIALLIVALVSGITMTLPSESLQDILHSPDSKDAVRKGALFLIELFQHLGIALFLFRLALRSPGRVRLAVRALILAAFICTVAALMQYARHAPALHVRGLMQSRQVYGGMLCVVLPLVLGSLLGTRRRSVRAVYAVVIALMSASILSGAAFLCAILGLAATGLCCGRGSGWKAAGACAGLGLALVILVPGTRRGVQEFAHFRARTTVGAGSVTPGAPPAVVIKKQYVEWVAGIYMMSEHFWLGVGPGQYQLNIGQYYGEDPNPAERLEPDTNNLYLVYGASLGFAGLMALFQVVGGALSRSWRAARAGYRGAGVSGDLQSEPAPDVSPISLPLSEHPGLWAAWWRGAEGTAMASGVFGALVAFTFMDLFTSLFVRAAGILFPFLLALALAARAGAQTEVTLALPADRAPGSAEV